MKELQKRLLREISLKRRHILEVNDRSKLIEIYVTREGAKDLGFNNAHEVSLKGEPKYLGSIYGIKTCMISYSRIKNPDDYFGFVTCNNDTYFLRYPKPIEDDAKSQAVSMTNFEVDDLYKLVGELQDRVCALEIK